MASEQDEEDWRRVRQYMRVINEGVIRILGDHVATGPFAGMCLPNTAIWEDGNYGCKLIGSYEFELHRVLEIALRRQPKTIINIGCAEGYYAVGLAMIAPKARIIANDIDPKSLAVCMANARLNGVEDRITPVHACYRPHQLDTGEHRRLYIVDCEGGELFILDPALCPSLARSDIIVECHDFCQSDISAIIARRFDDTHIVGLIEPQAPDPAAYPFLASLHPFGVRLLAVTDKRPPQGTVWLVCWAK